MRISRDQMFMDVAEVIAKRSTCLRNNVGAVIVDDSHNIMAIGYNGPASGCEHCTISTCLGKGCSRSMHAEENAINRIAFLKGEFSLYVTVSPCISCAAKIVESCKIKKVFYRYAYRLKDGINYLLESKIQVYRVLPSGEVIKETYDD